MVAVTGMNTMGTGSGTDSAPHSDYNTRRADRANREGGDRGQVCQSREQSRGYRIDRTDPLQNVLGRLRDVKPRGSGHDYTALCPAHNDREPSLSVSRGSDGRVLVHCFAGCSTDAVLARLGLTLRDLFPPSCSCSESSGRGRSRDRESAPSERPRPRPRRTTDYRYEDHTGRVVAIKRRYDYADGTKRFEWLRPDPSHEGHYQKGLGGIQVADLPLYGLANLVRSGSGSDKPVLLVEGEKACDALAERGFVAVSLPGGAGQKEFGQTLEPLVGCTVILWPDNDDAGRGLMRRVAEALATMDRDRGGITDVRWLQPADSTMRPKDDAHDYFARGGTPDKLRVMMHEAQRLTETEVKQGQANRQLHTRGTGAISQAARLVSLINSLIGDTAGCELFHTPEGEAFTHIPVDGHKETLPLRSKAFRNFVARLFYQTERSVPGAQALQDALSVLEGQALYEGCRRPVYVRVARHEHEHESAIYLDLANDRWQAVRITAGGWQVVADPPVRFRRPRGMLPLPVPLPLSPDPDTGTGTDTADMRTSTGRGMDRLRPFVNVGQDEWALLLAFTVGCLKPEGPYPVLTITGEQGTAKTTLARLLRNLIDPNTAPVRSEPRDARDLMIAARNNWLLAFDNLSRIPEWLSDALCRLSTGGGFATRELYTDADEVILDAQRPIILTSIEDLVTRPDLLDRALIIRLEPIPDGRRRPEAELWREFDAVRPLLLGCLLDAACMAMAMQQQQHQPGATQPVQLRQLPQLSHARVPELPRMADFACWAMGAAPGLGFAPGDFMVAYTGNRAEADSVALEAEPVAGKLLEFMDGRSEWRGTASQLLAELNNLVGAGEIERREGWPARSDKLSGRLRRLAPGLRSVGIDVTFARRADRGRGRLIVIRKCLQDSAQ